VWEFGVLGGGENEKLGFFGKNRPQMFKNVVSNPTEMLIFNIFQKITKVFIKFIRVFTIFKKNPKICSDFSSIFEK
jgi:hypothetical protein